ncbi:MAG TPA: SCO1664 family protein [Acidimicrobiales bacterium]|nr:SCO1664 family protein [Acidimicrobiales bacterium]MDP6240096.1 SCO1664 family protein [Acidimicrobiales bacterium]MDP7125057.1 SCO1664 family protein [Acidimicrobiales bacterium]MDP7351356.1 SCO1664 family protein [Acidimicrobiales bacterium]MDP7506918.1 SCO1664 family protein [Acidimicrobiales bacterium]
MPTEGAPGAGAEVTESPFRPRPPIGDDIAEEALRCGEIEVLGRMPWSSNATFLVDVRHGDLLLQGVYKPARGERPLHDFPPGIYRREAAAWELARHLGWGLIPPTVVRDGPLGEGSIQLYVPCDYDQHFFTLRDDPQHVAALRRLAAFDLVANSTDRKAGHVLLGDDGDVWAVDNALCFHHQFKVRTVIWDWGGEPLADALLADLDRLVRDGLPEALAALLDPFERDAVLTRAAALGEDGVLPIDPSGRRIPWPLL